MRAAFAEGTSKKTECSTESYFMFRNIYGLRSIPATTETLCLFVQFLYNLYSFLQIRGVNKNYISGPSCSKLTTSLVNDSLKFTSNDMQIC